MSSVSVTVEQEPRSGAGNMAADAAALDAAAAGGPPSVRWYRWSEPTLSLGHFQKAVPPDAPAGLPVVRRLSGGGAIVHDRDWTYCVCVPADHPLARPPDRLYRAVHGAVIEALAAAGVTAMLRGDGRAGRDDTFLCFARQDPRDVLVRGGKVLGSAQRRRRGAVMQHGSLLLAASGHVPHLAGLRELCGVDDAAAGRIVRDAAGRIAAVLRDPPSGVGRSTRPGGRAG